jgi:hypothetical protein
MRRLAGALVAVLVVAACARMAAPPGGPTRREPPILVGTYPDSGVAPCDLRAPAEFRFDEVTSDAGQPNFGLGDGTLERLVILSPDTAVPSVEWHRDRITVRPRGGWRPNRVYRIEFLPGLIDLHQNTSKSGGVIAFATCGPKPTRTLSGRVIDWVGQRPVPTALIEAFHLPDSVAYRVIADSTGRFRIGGLPDGPYLVVASSRPDAKHRRNPGEPWDSVRVAATRDTVGEIWTFPRDTTPPRITGVARVDSQTISVTYNKPIDPTLRLDTILVRVGLLRPPDTVSIGVVEALPKAYSDSIHKPVPVPRTPKEDSAFRVDSLKRDSIAKARPPAPAPATNVRPAPPPDLPAQKRPKLENVLVIRTRGAVRLDQSYWVAVAGVHGPGGVPGRMAGMTLLKDLAKIRADSLARIKADSLKADSLKKAKGDTTKVIKP